MSTIRTTKSWAEAERFLDDLRGRAADSILRLGQQQATIDHLVSTVQRLEAAAGQPIQMRLSCPTCGELHIDEGEFATKVHHTHACQACGNVWRPAIVPTTGVRFLPGFKNYAPVVGVADLVRGRGSR